jgi:DNA-binding transcriptional ArsR family regulator
MADAESLSDFWRDLAWELGKLNRSAFLRAERTSESSPWRVIGTDTIGRSVQLQFETLARRGAAKLNTGEPLLAGWFIELERRIPEAIEPLRAGQVIHRVNEVSADLCKILENEFLDIEYTPEESESTIAQTVETIETIAEQLRRLRAESRLTVEALTEALTGIDQRSVERHLSGDTIPRIGNIGAYERVFSKQLKRQVVISIMPVKRR